jgi:hypothetical protein
MVADELRKRLNIWLRSEPGFESMETGDTAGERERERTIGILITGDTAGILASK